MAPTFFYVHLLKSGLPKTSLRVSYSQFPSPRNATLYLCSAWGQGDPHCGHEKCHRHTGKTCGVVVEDLGSSFLVPLGLWTGFLASLNSLFLTGEMGVMVLLLQLTSRTRVQSKAEGGPVWL